MSANDIDNTELAKWDPTFTAQAKKLVAPIINRWFRVEVRGLESLPPAGGVLVVSNHSGGALTPDPLVFGPAYYDMFGYDRPLYILAHYGVFFTPLRRYLGRIGTIHASPENAAKALHSGAVVLVYPGGDYDAYRPTHSQIVVGLWRPHRIRQGRHRNRCADRARSVDRGTGNPTVPDPRRSAGQAIGFAPDPARHSAAQRRFSLRCDGVLPG
jgi:hypothetical protein